MKQVRFRMLFGVSAAAVALSWIAGYGWFIMDAWRPSPLPPVSDGIVALTGGSGRVETSLWLLEKGRGQRLLISGVDPHVKLSDMAPDVPADIARRVTLGYRATSTVGNAVETTDWVRQSGIHTLIVVTAGYHIRRAMLEMSWALPDVVLRPFAVQSPALTRPLSWHTLRLLAREYNKLILASVGPPRLFLHRSDA